MNRPIHIVGRKNSGKTTLIVDLVRRLTELGVRVGTIKHTHHHHELDTPGKDSHCHRQAGAVKVGIMASGMNALFWNEADHATDRYDRMVACFSDCGLVLVEGHSTGPGVKVEVWRAAIDTPPLANDDPSILAIVTNDKPAVTTPIWGRDDIVVLANRILELACDPSQ